jgi:hypothetical protein
MMEEFYRKLNKLGEVECLGATELLECHQQTLAVETLPKPKK